MMSLERTAVDYLRRHDPGKTALLLPARHGRKWLKLENGTALHT
jgi:hypothetical protein